MAELQRLRIDIPGAPIPKKAHESKSWIHDGHIRTTRYVPKATEQYQHRVRTCALAAGAVPLEGPLRVVILCLFPSVGAPLKRSRRPRTWKPTRPDCDNLTKSVLDGLRAVAFLDDAQVCDVRTIKAHAAQGEAAGVTLLIEQLEPMDVWTLDSVLLGWSMVEQRVGPDAGVPV